MRRPREGIGFIPGLDPSWSYHYCFFCYQRETIAQQLYVEEIRIRNGIPDDWIIGENSGV